MISLSLVLLFHGRNFFFALKGNLSALCTRFRFHTNNIERLNSSWRTDLSTLYALLDPIHWYDHFMDAVFSYLRLKRFSKWQTTVYYKTKHCGSLTLSQCLAIQFLALE